MATESVIESDAVIWPGEFLAEELEARDMSQRQLAAIMGRPPQAINEIVRGKKALTAVTALELERALGIPAYLWLRMEARYRLALARRRQESSAKS
jgi:HTH-type transcriptional regulator / antitoxin HigA